MSETQFDITQSLSEIQENLAQLSLENERSKIVQKGTLDINEILRKDVDINTLCEEALSYLANFSNALVGTIYLMNEDKKLELAAGYALRKTKAKDNLIYEIGEGLVGQVAKELKTKHFDRLPANYLAISSGTGKTKTSFLIAIPMVHEGVLIGVVELGKHEAFSFTESLVLESFADTMSISLYAVKAKLKTQSLLQLVQAKEAELNSRIVAINKSNLTIEFDLNGHILNVNDNFLELMGYTAEEAIGQHHCIFVTPEYAKSKEYKDFWKTLRSGEFSNGEFSRVTKSNETIWLNGSYNPVYNENGEIVKIMKLAVDITDQMSQRDRLTELAKELQMQHEELQQTNEELEEQTQQLEEQAEVVEAKNKDLEKARKEVEEKAKQLEVSNKYKSEFLANMSHELRTPLNSLLILSKDLINNKEKNLTPDQIESAEIINKCGYDLLNLINEILDLSKVEAGKMELNLSTINVTDLSKSILQNFSKLTEEKGIQLEVDIDKNMPKTMHTDFQRLSQVVKNLLSNAIKFTEKGHVKVTIFSEGEIGHLHVSDTGIGIPEDKIDAIFEAFQQADGSTSRKYGGTGLGLSISRELAKLIGGNISAVSQLGKGSTFKLSFKINIEQDKKTSAQSSGNTALNEDLLVQSTNRPEFINYPSIEDQREDIGPEDMSILIIEDDLVFAQILANQATEKGFKYISASSGEDGLILAEKYQPNAIVLDLDLPGKKGDTVLKELKANTDLRHIPVHIMSGQDKRQEFFNNGALEFLTKPISKDQVNTAFQNIEEFIKRKMKHLMVIEDNDKLRRSIVKIIKDRDVKCYEAKSGQEAIDNFKQQAIDCIVLDLGLPDMNWKELINGLKTVHGDKRFPPIIVYTGKELSKEENDELRNYTETIIVKGVKSEERLLDETALFLHRTVNDLTTQKQQIIADQNNGDAVFEGKKVLLVDDDMRNIFALGKVLREKGFKVVKADNGVTALKALEENMDTDMVLMDIMMPEMDGYECMQEIRKQPEHDHLPILALTAKAMKDDRQKCIDAGASDYIAKPVDIERLFSLMKIWM